jgi:effector-binding domain-containing protein
MKSLIRNVRVKTEKPFAFLRGSAVCAYEKVPETGLKLMAQVEAHMQASGIRATGSSIWRYDAAGPGKVTLSAGYPVKAGTRGKAPLTARKESPWKCLSCEYVGPMPRIIDAWMELFDEAEKRGLAQDGARREIYRTWVGMNSRGNVTELQLKVR